MAGFAISYDLQQPGQEYDDLHDAIRSYPAYSHILESTWLISTSTSAASEIRDDLSEHVDGNDKILVTKIGSAWATNFTNDHTDWMHDEL